MNKFHYNFKVKSMSIGKCLETIKIELKERKWNIKIIREK